MTQLATLQSRMEVPEPPPWPLAVVDENDPAPGGIGPLAALFGRALAATAKRRMEMMNLAEVWRKQMKIEEVCGLCGVTEDDPFVKERIGEWAHGCQFRVKAIRDILELTTTFERHHGVPPMPLQNSQWKAWLERHEVWMTLCIRCRGGLPSPRSDARSDGGSMPSSPTSTVSPWERSDRPAASPRRTSTFEEVDVPQEAREMILYWAREAKVRIRARRGGSIRRPEEPLQVTDVSRQI